MGLTEEMSTNGILYVNSINCLPFLVVYSLLTSEFAECLQFVKTASLDFWGIFTVVITAGCVLNYSQFLCTTMNSALTTSIVGVMKSVITTIIGMFTFGGVPLTTYMVMGVSMNIVGAFWYTFAKYRENLVGKLKKISSNLPLNELGDENGNGKGSSGHSKSNGYAKGKTNVNF